MTPYAYYLVKVALCSGILFGYYWIALRNKTFHQWNRIYLLACVVLSLAAPLLKIHIGTSYAPAPARMFHLLQVVESDTEVVVESNARTTALTPEQWLLLAYGFVSSLLLLVIVVNSARIYNILRSHAKTKIETIYFLNTDVKGTPFSFFHYIIWNRNIDLNTENGQRIFKHELAHVTQRHTWDKAFMLLVLIPFWINPFFWMIRRELTMLHEFDADKKALEQHDAAALAHMILNTAFPQQQLLFTNHFFQSTIKRRLAMFTKLQHPTVSYFSRIAALPLLLIVIASFALKTRPQGNISTLDLDKTITVIIDPGHGGKSGARSGAVYEDDLALAISKRIKAQNSNEKIRIILTREDDQLVALKRRVEIAAENKADLFLSIHVNAAGETNAAPSQPAQTGIEVVVSGKNSTYQQQSEVLGSVLVQEFSNVYTTQKNLIKAKTGVWVIDQNVCPSVLVECGYLTNQADRNYITQEKNQTLLADKILDAIEQYGILKNTGMTPSANDTVPKHTYNNKEVSQVLYFKEKKDSVLLLYNDKTNEIVSKEAAKNANLLNADTEYLISMNVRKATPKEAETFYGVIELDGKKYNGYLKDLPVKQEELQYLSILTGSALPGEYGVKEGDSVLSISTKAYIKANRRTDNEPLFTKAETEPKFPDTNGGFISFLQKNLNADIPSKKGAKPGTYEVQIGFIVDVDGKLYDMKPLTKYGYGMEDEVLRVLRISPDWVPAKQNGKAVTFYKKQSVTFIVSNT